MKNLNFEFSFRQIRTFPEKFFSYLPSTRAHLEFTDFPLLADLSKIGTLFA